MSLIDDLKAAPGMSQCHARDYCGEPGDIHTNICRIVEEDVFNEIIAALEEREQVVAILRRWHSAYSSEKYTDAEADAHAEAESWLERHGA